MNSENKLKIENETAKDENVERGNWSGKLDFFLSLLGYSVGLGNVWRFPYLCYRNGGGAFLIPYTLMLILVGMPLFFMEIALGQFTSCGPLKCWDFAPIFQGLGIAQVIVSGLVSIYYNMIIGWSLFYFFSSIVNFQKLPWTDCLNPWNTKYCYDNLPDVNCNSTDEIRYSNGTCYDQHSRMIGLWDFRIFHNVTNVKRTLASEEYYNIRMLNLSAGIEDIGGIQWELLLCLILSWIITFVCMLNGIKTTGKVVYFTALFPYVVLVILLIRGVTLPGAGQGLLYYLTPDFNRLKDSRVWNDAAIQMFFALNNCWGGLITLSSYNRFNNNCLNDAVIVALINYATGVFAGFVIFSFIGFMADHMGVTVAEVAISGPGLAFIVYPFAVTKVTAAAVWCILFFALMLTLGLDSQFASMETILTSMIDQFPNLRPRKTLVIFILCIVLLLLGLPHCTRGGSYLLLLMDSYCSFWGIMVIGILECVAISWCYGCSRFFKDIEIMLGKPPSIWWRICWQIITPGFLIFGLIMSWVDYKPTTYDSYTYPIWADAMGWGMSLVSVIFIPIVAIWKIRRELSGSLRERIYNLSLPTIHWGPALSQHRKLVTYVEDFQVYPKKDYDFTHDTLLANNSIDYLIRNDTRRISNNNDSSRFNNSYNNNTTNNNTSFTILPTATFERLNSTSSSLNHKRLTLHNKESTL